MAEDYQLVKLLKPFKSKIVGHEEVKIDQLLANPNNWRLHTLLQQEALAGSIDEIGYIRSVTVNQRSGTVIDGHLRIVLLWRSEVKTVWVEYVDLTDDEERKALLMIDPISALAASDNQKLNELLKSTQSDDPRVQKMFADLAEKNGLYDMPSLDDLDDQYGGEQEGDMWPLIKVKVPPDLFKRWSDLMARAPAEEEHEKVRLILDAVNEAQL